VPQPFLGFLLQSVSLTGIAHPSRGHFAPLQSSTGVLKGHHRDLIAIRFLDARAFAQLPDSPNDYGLPFHSPESSLPGCPGSQRRDSSRSAGFTYFEALILLRVRSR
jgi:hypothetical protein